MSESTHGGACHRTVLSRCTMLAVLAAACGDDDGALEPTLGFGISCE